MGRKQGWTIVGISLSEPHQYNSLPLSPLPTQHQHQIFVLIFLRVWSGQHFRDYHKSAREGREAHKDQDQEEASSFMWDHMKDRHPDIKTAEDIHFKFEVVTGFRDPLTRQITEAIRIGQARDDQVFYNSRGEGQVAMTLNRKSEFFSPRERDFSF